LSSVAISEHGILGHLAMRIDGPSHRLDPTKAQPPYDNSDDRGANLQAVRHIILVFVTAEVAEPNVSSPARAATSTQPPIKGSNLPYAVSVKGKPGFVTNPYAPETIAANRNHLTRKFTISYLRDKYLYDVEISGTHGPTYSKQVNFDGQHFELFNRLNEILKATNGTMAFNDVVMNESHFAFMPFLFLESAYKSNAFAEVSYMQLTKPEDWKNAAMLLQKPGLLEEVSVNNQKYLVAHNIGSDIAAYSQKETDRDGFPTRVGDSEQRQAGQPEFLHSGG
jgi:hypothetical protein